MDNNPKQPIDAQDVELFKAYSIQELEERRLTFQKDAVTDYLDLKFKSDHEN